ncbi:MAG: diguanylate cyclase [Myxococcales bacterium]|nr:diguanylate cyclase [Myxococcales bacterium]
MVASEWDDETTAAGVAELDGQAGSARNATLTVLTGTATGQMFKVSHDLMIGRAPTASVRVDDDGVSRNHARIRFDEGCAWAEDLKSRNGTYVNGTRLSGTIKLADGDKIQVGRSTILRFAFQDALDESFHENLLSSALRDSLTKLFNKRYLMDRLDSELKFAQRHETALSLLMIDIDHFKKVNDTHGHLAGDAVLARLAGVLIKTVRNEDVVARFGGEEIAIVLRAINIDGAAQMGERVRRLVEQTETWVAGQELRATVSIGVACFPATPVKTPEALIEAADRALYRAKNAGRNRVSR